jgi:ATP-binding cassette subfamily B protein/subfamily B ATP-binding cassette protein MsbA
MYRNFRRTLWLALRQKYSFVAALVCSLMVGVCWGANIGTFFPFVEVVFRGESLQSWVGQQIRETDKKAQEIEVNLTELRNQLETTTGPRRQELAHQVALQESRLGAERSAGDYARAAEPWIRDWLPDSPFETLVILVVLLWVGTVVRNLFFTANTILVERIGQRVSLDLRNRCFRKTLGMEQRFLDTKHTGEWMNQLTGNVNALAEGVKAFCGTGIREPFRIIACLVGAALISWRLLILSFVFIPLALFLTSRLSRVARNANGRMARGVGEFFQRLAESFTLITVIKAFTLEHYERSRFRRAATKLYHHAIGLTGLNSLARSGTELLGTVVVGLAILMGGYLVLNQQTHLFGIMITERPLGAGSLLLFFAFLIGANEPARRLPDLFGSLYRAAAVADQVYLLIDQRPELGSRTKALPLPPRPRTLEFQHASFGYCPGHPVLQDVSFGVRAGETLAIVGPSGSGKTTLASLILRFYDPDQGVVRLEGTDLRDLRPRDLRKRIGVVTQQPLLFDDTVRDNIRLGALKASEERIIAAARKAHAHSFIEQLEGGYLYQVGEKGCRLSGGQRQRLALARAILRDPAVLILDEATNQIDGESEQLILGALNDFVRDRITILITHRPSMLALADRVLVLDGGRVLDLGTHQELMARCDLYRRLNFCDLKCTA